MEKLRYRFWSPLVILFAVTPVLVLSVIFYGAVAAGYCMRHGKDGMPGFSVNYHGALKRVDEDD